MTKQCIINKPWGRERILEVNDRYVVKILEVEAGQEIGLQFHEEKRETMYCLYGFGTFYVFDNDQQHKKNMMPGRYFTISPGGVYKLVASKTSPVVILECSSPELDDVIR